MLATNGLLVGDVRIFEEEFVRQDKGLFGNLHTKITQMPA
jgi:hypothetical protein